MKSIFPILLLFCVLATACEKNVLEEVTYSIAVTATDGGNVAATVDGERVTQAAKGTVITLTATAEKNYEFVGWTATSGDVDFAATQAATTTFKMPAGDVAIEAEFSEIIITTGTAGALTWTLSPDGNLTIQGQGAMPDYGDKYSSPWFEYRDEIKTVIIENGVTSIGDLSFDRCRALTSIPIPDSVTSIGDGAFYYCRALTSITIPDSVKSIGNGAFAGCEALASITIPDSVTSIGYGAFPECDALTSVTIMCTTPPTLGSSDNFTADGDTLYVPAGCVDVYKANAAWNNAFTYIVEQQ